MPFFAAVMAWLIDRERFGPSRLIGFALIVAAMLAIGGSALIGGHGAGRLLVTVASVMWAGYTLAFRRSGLDAVAGAGIVAAWSTLILLPFVLVEGFGSLLAVGPAVIASAVITQGILTGIIALICYGAAVRILGSSRAALLGALPPAIAAVLAIPLLGEIPSLVTILGIVFAVAGVSLATGALKLGR